MPLLRCLGRAARALAANLPPSSHQLPATCITRDVWQAQRHAAGPAARRHHACAWAQQSPTASPALVSPVRAPATFSLPDGLMPSHAASRACCSSSNRSSRAQQAEHRIAARLPTHHAGGAATRQLPSSRFFGEATSAAHSGYSAALPWRHLGRGPSAALPSASSLAPWGCSARLISNVPGEGEAS